MTSETIARPRATGPNRFSMISGTVLASMLRTRVAIKDSRIIPASVPMGSSMAAIPVS